MGRPLLDPCRAKLKTWLASSAFSVEHKPALHMLITMLRCSNARAFNRRDSEKRLEMSDTAAAAADRSV